MNDFFAIATVFAQGSDAVSEETSGFSSILSGAPFWIMAVLVAVVFYIVARLVSSRISDYLMRRQQEYMTLDAHKGTILLAERMTFLIILALGILLALSVSGLMSDLGWLIGSLGLAIGFAMQGFFSNYVSGMMLLAQEKTKVGNFIELDGMKGIIKEIGMRATLIQTFEGLEILIPNKHFFESPVTVYTSNPFRRISMAFDISYDASIPKAMEIITRIMDAQPEVLQDHPKGVLVKEWGDSSIVLSARFWVKSKSAWWKVKSNMLHQVWEAFIAEGIDVPYNTIAIESKPAS